MKLIKKLLGVLLQVINRPLNKEAINSKVFCIGLHKTGTTTLARYFKRHGFKVTHSTNWIDDKEMLGKFDFFSDGGSHFDGINEFDFERLFHTFKDARFILQTRDTEKWVISKLKHAGWRIDTKVEDDDQSKITHQDWTYKSYLTIQKIIEHKVNYEKKVISFFAKNGPERLIVVDITKKEKQSSEIKKIKDFVGLKAFREITLPHANKRKSVIRFSDDVYATISRVLSETDQKA